ncbi:MAG: hypothetical protein OXM61_17135 [Candidatus Poribacteria bacterium]|nr:hypothetical protein [Candidatus Poribacteria bacterium]
MILHKLKQRGGFQIIQGVVNDGYTDTVWISQTDLPHVGILTVSPPNCFS